MSSPATRCPWSCRSCASAATPDRQPAARLRSSTSSPTWAIAPTTSTPKDPQRDNILKISNDGRNASLDPRMVHLGAPTAQPGRCGRRASHGCAPRQPTTASTDDPDTGDCMPDPRRACRSCSATAAPRRRIRDQFTIYRPSKTNWSPEGCRRRRSGSSTTPQAHEVEAAVRAMQSRRGVGAASAAPRRWAPAATCSRAWSPCITSMCRGGQPTWSSARAASCGRATRTDGSTSSTTSPKAATTR